jgi:hypothetical protein
LCSPIDLAQLGCILLKQVSIAFEAQRRLARGGLLE